MNASQIRGRSGKATLNAEKNNGRNKPHQSGGHQRYDTALQLRCGTVALSMLFSQKVVNRYAEQFRKHDKNKNIGNTVRSLPFGDGFIRIVDFFGKLRLGKVAFTPVAHNVFGNGFFHFFIISNYHEAILQQQAEKSNRKSIIMRYINLSTEINKKTHSTHGRMLVFELYRRESAA